MTSASFVKPYYGGRSEVDLVPPPLESHKMGYNTWACFTWKDVLGLIFRHWYAQRRVVKEKNHLREKFENATHYSFVIVFSVDRWEENPIRLYSGEFPFPSLHLPTALIERHTDRQPHTDTHCLSQPLNRTHLYAHRHTLCFQWITPNSE